MKKKKIEFETFRKVGSYETMSLTQKEPSCFNGILRVRKYKVTIEPIDESKEVIAERIQALWDECDNWHHWELLKDAANEIGYVLSGKAGGKLKKK